jgi:ferredoxin
MAQEITISIDNRAVHTREGTSILKAADLAGIYIPRLCYHPELPTGPKTKADARMYRCGESITSSGSDGTTYQGCNLCVVEIEGKGCSLSCTTVAEEGMIVHSDTAKIRELRKENLARAISQHPHACILCSENEGCDRDACSQGVGKESRCCSKFDDCEFRKVCEYVTIKNDVSQYIFKDVPITDTPFFTMNPNLCIGCTRCVRACEMTQGKRVIGFLYRDKEFVLGTTGASHKESGCVFCGACVAVCPTGALMDKGLHWKKKAELNFASNMAPPENELACTEENLEKVPELDGVYQLIDGQHEIVYIHGAANMRQDLKEKLPSVEKARFFRFEAHGMYTMRENEMLERFLKKYGKLPEVNNEIADLY